jgi:titin
MKTSKIFFPLLFTLMFFSCNREWDNPYDPDTDLDFTKPVISSITVEGFTALKLIWSANDESYTKIQIERKNNLNWSFNTISVIHLDSAESYLDTGLTHNNTYYYRLLGLVDEREGEYSEMVPKDLVVPPPTNVTATDLNDQEIRITWSFSLGTTANAKTVSKNKKINKKQNDIKSEKIKMTARRDDPDFKGKKENLFPRLHVKDGTKETRLETDQNNNVSLKTTGEQTGAVEGFKIERKRTGQNFNLITNISYGVNHFVDTALDYGPTYTYRVCAYGQGSNNTTTYTASSPVQTTFPAPTNLVATATSDQSIALSWSDNCSFEDGYEIWRKVGSGSYEILDSTAANGTAYVDSGLTYGENYTYKVRAFTELNLSDYAAEVSTATTFPAPTNLVATATSDQSITLSWSDNCSFEDGYEIWRKVGSGSYEILDSTAANGTAYADSWLTYGENYTYKVRAFTELNISNYSNEEPIVLIILPPSDLILTALNDQVMQLSWSDNCLFEAGQELWRQAGAGSFAFLDSLNTDVTAYNDSSLTYSESYSYKLRSFTIQNVSAFSDSVSGVTVFPAPSNLSADVLNDHQVELTWDDNCGFEDGYEIQQLEGAGEWEIIDSVQANGSMYTISGLTYGVSYEFKVKAFTDINSSDFSDSVTGSTVFPAPSNLSILQSGDDAVLSWADNSSFETGFNIEKSVEAAPFAEIDTVASDLTTYTDTDIDAISQYRYRVRAFTENNYSDYSEEVEFSLFTGDIYYISPVGSDFTGNGSANYPYKTVQKGIDVAGGDSSLILVANGTYNESIDYSGKELTVASYFWLDADTSHVSATTISAVEGRVVNIDADGSELLGFTVTSGAASQGSGIYASDQVTIANCIITGNSYTGTGSGGGIYCADNSEVTISTCTITGNSITGNGSEGAGVYCGSSTTVNFTDCTITANTLTGNGSTGTGIYASAITALTLSSCVVNENAIVGESAAGAGVHSVGATLDVTDCDISGNTVTTEYPEGAFFEMQYSVTLNDSYGDGWNGCSIDVLVNGIVIFNNLTIYSGSSAGPYYFTVINEDIITTTFSAGSYVNETSYQIFNENGTNVASASSGGTISYVVQGMVIGGTKGVGIYSSADLTIDNSTINNNEIIIPGRSSGPYGGGVFATGSLTMTDSETSNNGADGVYCTSSNASYTAITATGNGSYGVYSGGSASFTNITANTNGANGLYDEVGTSIFDNCTASGNTGDGIYTAGDGTFSNCTANNNASGRGIWCDGAGSFTTCETHNNFSDGIYASDGSDFTGCTSEDNGGYGLYCGSAGTFFGCSSESNGSTGIFAGSGTSTVDGCDVTNNSGAGVSIGGDGTFNSLTITGNGGTGISAGSGGSFFTDCELNNNAGTGISVGDGTSTFTDITVSNSSAGRGIYNGGTGEFVNVTVSGSSSDGIYTGASTSLNNCSSSSNGGYGIWVESAGFLTNCATDGNDKGIYVGAYSSEIINCLATNNTTYGMELLNSSTLIQNCTVSDNGTGVFAGGTSGPAFMNVILYDNTTELDGESSSTYTIDYSDVEGGETFGAWATGSGNIDADPLFVGSGDYNLQNGSPCIDAGNPGVQYNDADGSQNDMGAFGGPNGDW